MLAFSRLGLSVPLRSAFRPALRPVLISALTTRSLFVKTITQPPGDIIGTVNEAYVVPTPNKFTGSRAWTMERLAVVAMTPLMLAPFIAGSAYAPLDAAMSTLLLYHCYAGFESCIIDYIPARVYGVWHSVAMGLLALGSLFAGCGIYVIETTEEEGLFGLCKKLWTKQKAI
ncbi:hypothetical protein FOA43_002247 [Brettanomyces nanus]|uniref:Succinate dehydrogenase [ubiquinone] cytochrome b small subunit n=1 Tax=Eeniella nana TaxID=13502 RepID=A0A875S566_EENNA|nr:uncharacterized protein FOA43_002247 [Brettanomyces nanus]QPG74909.1 hypothetical protein FOA43_002247 [Brettanomyces nanus]